MSLRETNGRVTGKGRLGEVVQKHDEGDRAIRKATADPSASSASADFAQDDSYKGGEPMTLAQVREELKGVKGKKLWRSVDELANTPEFQAAVEREFPEAAQEWVDPVSRRGFLKLMGASMALAGVAGCTKQPDEAIYPYIKQPEDLVLG